jgi:hypothetical protein
MAECIVSGGMGILATSIYGVSLREFIPELVKVGIFAFITKKRRNVLKKFSLILVVYLYGYYPHKKIRMEMLKKLKKIFKKYSTLEIYRIYKYYKKLKLLFYDVGFEDNYFRKNIDELICNPLKMKNYLIKKLYVQHIFKIILVKLYNNMIDTNEQNRLKEDLVSTFIESNITYEDLENVLNYLSDELKLQYKNNLKDYENDFCKEKNYLKAIFENISKKNLSRKVKSSVKEICEILDDTENVNVKDISAGEIINNVKDRYKQRNEECDVEFENLDKQIEPCETLGDRINRLRSE